MDDKGIKIFPRDCNGCKHFHFYDLSVDDLTYICNQMNIQVDGCDWWYNKIKCPKVEE